MTFMNNSITFFEIFKLLIVPIVVAFFTVIIARMVDRKKRKKELDQLTIQVEKTKIEISQIKASFQPLVLATIQKTQEALLQDKIQALKEIASFRAKVFTLSNTYYEGMAMNEDQYDFYSDIFWRFGDLDILEFQKIVSEKGYLFPESIKIILNVSLGVISDIVDLNKYQASLQDQSMHAKAPSQIDQLNTLIEQIINEIRIDLHIDSTFIKEFIDKYKN